MVAAATIGACGDDDGLLSPATREEPPSPGKPPSSDAAKVERRMERLVFDLVNDERSRRGLHPLTWDDQLASLAQNWNQQMAKDGRLHHQDPQRMLKRSEGFVGVGENIFRATGRAPASTIHVSWMRSDGHRANVLRESFNRIGVGVSCTGDGHVWATQRFGRTTGADLPRADDDVPPQDPIVAQPGHGPACPGSPAKGEIELRTAGDAGGGDQRSISGGEEARRPWGERVAWNRSRFVGVSLASGRRPTAGTTCRSTFDCTNSDR